LRRSSTRHAASDVVGLLGAEGARELGMADPYHHLDRATPLYFLISVQKLCMSKKLAGCW
jgi:hypothetical protein